MIGLTTKMPASTTLFNVPRQLLNALNRDLAVACIPKTDQRGRTLDVHALRHSFGTLLSSGGVAPRTAQAAMRHSTIDLTMNVYTDPKLLDVLGALDVLPALPLSGGTQNEAIDVKATGTEDSPLRALAPQLAPTPDNSSKWQSIVDKMTVSQLAPKEQQKNVVSLEMVKRNKPLTTLVNGLQQERETGFEPATSSLGS